MRERGGLRLIAAFEAAKGVLVLTVGTGLLVSAHRPVQALADELIAHLHLNPASRSPRIFLHLLAQLDNTRLQVLALGALAYSGIRLAEAYGLWRSRRWAEWLGAASAGIYIPFELYELSKGVSALKVALFLVNAGVLLYLLRVLRKEEEPAFRRHP